MKATYRIVTPAAASAVAVLLLTACADKPVRIPGGAFVEEPYEGETISRSQTIQTNGEGTMESEVIYIEGAVPVGPVEDDGQQSIVSGQQDGQQGGPQVQPVEQQPEVKSNVPEGSVEYKVVKGDTLWGIGMVYGVSVARLAEINGIDEKSPLRIGQVLMIPPDAKNAVGKPIPQKKADETKASTTKPATSTTTKPASTTTKAQPVAKDGETLYVVKSGDSLSVIAQRHHVKLADLVAANKVDPNGILRIGQTLVIPAASKTAAASSTTKPAASTSTTTKPAASAGTTQKTEPASTSTTTKPATTTPPKAGEGTGGVVEPIGGSSSGVTAPATATTRPAAGTLPALDPVAGIPDTDIITVPIDSESTLEEVANNHDRNLEDLIRLNPEFKPGQKIPAGTAVRMPLF